MIRTADIKRLAVEFATPLLEAGIDAILLWALRVAIVGALIVFGFNWFHSHYALAWDRQSIRCLDARVLLVDKTKRLPQRDAIVTYVSQQAAPIIANGTVVGKYIRGIPGDTVEVTPDERVLINGKEISKGMPHLYGINAVERTKFFGRRVLGDNEYWVMGTERMSFDSRYWGPIGTQQIIGRAYVLF